MQDFYRNALRVLIWLFLKVFDIPDISCCEEEEPPNKFFNFTEIRFKDGKIIRGDNLVMVSLNRGQEFDVIVEPVDEYGDEADYQVGTERWSSSDTSIATVEPKPDNPLQATVKVSKTANFGAAAISFEADMDPEEGEERQGVGALSVVVAKREAVTFEIQAGEVRDTSDQDTPIEENPENPTGDDTVTDEETMP